MWTRLAVVAPLLLATPALAVSLGDLSDRDAAGGLKEALTQGVGKAVALLGRTDGFLGNSQVRIPLPDGLRQAESVMRFTGMGRQAGELVTAMNRAAEAAVPEAKQLLVGAVEQMTVDDAKKILTGGDDSATRYFQSKTMDPLTQKFLPIVRKATEQLQLAQKYDELAGQGARLGLVRAEDATIEDYVTRKALDGLFFMIGEEEKAIRRDPLGAAGSLAQKVFGALGS